jgi:hypothetical protein
MAYRYLKGLVVTLYLTGAVSAADIYTTGFEPPTFAPGLFVGQDNWYAVNGVSSDAASVSTQALHGIQAVTVNGAKVEVDPAVSKSKYHPSNAPVYSGMYQRNLTYDPTGSATPLISLSANLNLFTADNIACGWAVGLGGDSPDGPVTFGLVSLSTSGGSFVVNTDGVMVSGPHYQLGTWANVTAIYNFETSTMRSFLDGELIGEIPFSNGIGSVIIQEAVVLGSLEPVPNLVASVDDLELRMVPEPGTLLLLSTGIFSFLAPTIFRHKGKR